MIENLSAWFDDFGGGRFLGPLDTYGVDPLKFITQLIVWLIPTVWSIFHVVRCRTGVKRAYWVLLILLLPFIGSLLALIFVRSTKR